MGSAKHRPQRWSVPGLCGCFTRATLVEPFSGKLPQAAVPTVAGLGSNQVTPPSPEQPDAQVILGGWFGGGGRRETAGVAKLSSSAEPGQGTFLTTWPTRSTIQRAQLHERLVEVRAIPSPICGETCRRLDQLSGQFPESASVGGIGLGRWPTPEPRKHPGDVAVHGGGRLVKGDRTDCAGGVVANANQRFPFLHGARPAFWKLFEELSGCGLQAAGAGVVAQTSPQLKQLLSRGHGNRAKVRQLGHPALEIRYHRRHLRLLQHDLGNPDGIRIGGATPGEVAGFASIVAQEPTHHLIQGRWRRSGGTRSGGARSHGRLLPWTRRRRNTIKREADSGNSPEGATRRLHGVSEGVSWA